MVIWPKKITKKNCSPDKINRLTSFIQTKSIMIIDKIKHTNDVVRIGGHVNRSGKNFLAGNTPHKNKEMFPDMSSIYTKTKTKHVTVHTVGEKRFLSKTKRHRNIIWSESIGLVAPVFSYLGFDVLGFGVPEEKVNIVCAEEFIHQKY